MKSMLAGILIAAGCGNHQNPSIEGYYVNGDDTLIVHDYNSAGIYLIRRNNIYKKEIMYGEYDFDSRKLMDNKYGRMFSFRDDEVLFGSVPYQKIK